MTDDDPGDVTVLETKTAPAESAEYDRAMTAEATVTGPQGPVRVRRRYNALPRHNDVVERSGADSNDELLARADEIYVHSKFYTVTDDEEEYFRDRHDTWRPTDSRAIGSEATFLELCRDHHRRNLQPDYIDTTADRR